MKGWLGLNPMREIKFPSESPHRERVISDEEIEILLPFLTTEIRAIFLIAIETGMRLSEICNLKWEKLNWIKFFDFGPNENGRARKYH